MTRGEMVELRVLNYFLTVAREESFTKAADVLHVTQPTLSRQIAALEKELGVRLFVRRNRAVVLTEAGLLLRSRAREVLAIANKTKQELLHAEQDIGGTIAIGSGEFKSTGCLASCLAEFRERHPRVKYEIVSGNAESIYDDLGHGLLDIGLVPEPVDIRSYEYIEMPEKEEWGIFVRDDWDLAKKEFVTPKDLADIPQISALNEFMGSRLGTWFGDLESGVTVAARGNLLYNEVMLAKAGMGITMGIRLECNYTGLKFVPLRPPLEISTAIVWKKEGMFSPAASAFIEFAKLYIKGIKDSAI